MSEPVTSAAGRPFPSATLRAGRLADGARRIGKLALLVSVYYAVFAYPPLRVLGWLGLGPASTPALLAVLVLPAAGWLVHQGLRSALTRAALRLTYSWMGACFIGLPIVLLADLLGAITPAAAVPDAALGGAALVVWMAVVLLAAVNAQRLVVRRLRVDAPGLKAPMRLVQLSDIHVGSRSRRFLARVVARANALAPDAVLITGDLVDLRALPGDVLAPLAGLSAPSFFAIGNHERYIGVERACAQVARYRVRVLRDESASLGPLQIVGIDDAERRDQVERRLAKIPIAPDRFSVLLYHRPDGLEAAAAAGIDLMLCGHTHNGQIVPFNLLVRRHFARICGRYGHAETILYVSPGTGTWGPVLRLGSRNEITEVTLCPAPPRCG